MGIQRLFNIGYFPTPLDIVIITEFSDWLWEHIFMSFSKKKERNGYSESLATLLSGTTVGILWRHLQKNRSIQSWVLEFFSVEVFHYFRPRCHDQRRRRPALAQKDIFQTLPHPSRTTRP